MNAFASDKNILTHYIWPFFFVFGCGLVHPMFVLGMRVQCAPFSVNPKATDNMFDCFNHIMKTQGKKGFYRGLMPSTLIYALCSYSDVSFAFQRTRSATRRYLSGALAEE